MCIESPKLKNNYTAQILLRKIGEHELADRIDTMLDQPFIAGSDMTVKKPLKFLRMDLFVIMIILMVQLQRHGAWRW